MVSLLHIALIVVLALAAIPVAVLLVQTLAALRQMRVTSIATNWRPSVAVLVPAHNEAQGIAATIAAIREQLRDGDRILIVADNCTDETVAMALAAGAPVLERINLEQRGKGYALDYGVQHLANSPPEVVLMIDADCQLLEGSIDKLACLAMTTQRPVQALDLMQAKKNAGLKMRIAEFAWIVKNHVRPLGFLRLGLPCQLMGTGMAFPWNLIESAGLANGNLAEDMQLGIEMARKNAAPIFCPDACVISYFPVGEEAARMQRTRWEHGHISMILQHGLPLLIQGFRRGDRMLIAMALDMCVPPVALLTLVTLALFIGAAIACFTFDWIGPLVLAGFNLLALTLAVLLAWQRFGRHVVSLNDLFSTVTYVFWKLPLYLKFLVSRQVEWVRAKRDAD
ncbi:glycosyltransferase family 2 protein [Herminiimonas fonticola]|uniref:Cellulose synthase/poly-beta-1,6-N-acetylglucosamine synthase-like glycosyltransferase n=1 Tax=Herminiimonas fonticola TaxID=303380 RepID=A0A4V3BV39_9BURK|nr:glycosyltransferase family 2 protein [Herminiimonas fonticola]RBA23000.1 Glycosyltransferase like family 2 [Herminiimonas fonticola]TDN89558.1 cellulose synthase/poly-beta-1,6-N-acetylglucosamine synthase-like glycosyltransferase [Herminiimonas fonticola]